MGRSDTDGRLVRRRLLVRGRVQGVWFRASAEREAARLGVAGFARNERDGSVTVEAEGPMAAVEAMEGTDEAVRRGLALAGRGAVVAKSPGVAHDYRLDVPTVGPDTVERCTAGCCASDVEAVTSDPAMTRAPSVMIWV